MSLPDLLPLNVPAIERDQNTFERLIARRDGIIELQRTTHGDQVKMARDLIFIAVELEDRGFLNLVQGLDPNPVPPEKRKDPR